MDSNADTTVLHTVGHDGMAIGGPVPAEFADRLGAAGLKLVPRTPTRRMIEAGRLAGNGDPAMAAAIFAAMLDAAD